MVRETSVLSNLDKVSQQLDATFCQKTFWMKLNAERWMGFVLDGHDFFGIIGTICPCAYFKLIRKRVRLDHQAVISRRRHWIGKPFKDRFSVVRDFISLTVHQSFGSNNLAARRLADRLMSKANSKQRKLAMKTLDAVYRDSGLGRCARARRNDQVAGVELLDLVNRNLIIAMDLDFEIQIELADSLHEVVCE